MNLLVRFFVSKIVSMTILFVLTLSFSSAASGAGELDSGFTASVFGSLNGNVNVVKIQPDGKILIGGFFTEVGGFAASGIARLNADGTVDTSFRAPDFFGGFGLGAQAFAIALQPDGKILVGGSFNGTDGVFNPGVRRLNADGSLDSSFTILTMINGSTIFDIEMQTDNKILVGGILGVANNSAYFSLIRLNSNGTLDPNFISNLSTVREIEIQSDGKIIAGGETNSSTGFLRRLNADGTFDNSFSQITTSGGVVEAVKIKPDGKILIGGNFTSINGFTQGRISLINADGSIDLTFNQNNQGANGAVQDIALSPDGKIIIGGGFSTYNASSRIKIARLNPDGLPDSSFLNNAVLNLAFVNDVELLPDGRILVGINNQTGVNPLTRFNADGTFDLNFAPFINRTGRVRKILQQPDGKVLVGGTFPFANGANRISIARFNADGSLDTSFVPFTNTLSPNQIVSALALQSNGAILVGTESGFGLRRMNSDGSLDGTFSTTLSGVFNDIVVLANGQILVGGSMGIRRLNANGTVDAAFATVQPNAQVHKILVQPDGQILICGDFTQIGAAIRGRIARLNGSDGSLDNSFNPPGGANGQVFDMDLQANGSIVIGGAFTALNGSSNQVRIGRLSSAGNLDPSFVQTVDASVLALKIQPDGKILIGGAMSSVQNIPHNGIARLKTDGTLDATFNTFANTQLWDINLQTDGKILIGGDFTKINRLSAVRVARLLNVNVSKTLFDFDADGKADVSVFRPSTNRWYLFLSSNNSVIEQTFGLAGDTVAPADFDGDGKTDIAIFRPSTGNWWYLSSIDSIQKSVQFGASGDIPRPSDFDGDGKADFIVFRPSNSVWYRLGSGGSVSVVPFGLPGDKPVSGDFDGDGKADVAIFRPSTGDWWYQSSINGAQLATRWGISTDIPAPADYDGDGKTDLAVYRASTGVWYIINSSTGSFTIGAFGLSEDKPVPADYDGDGRADIAVFRPSTGVWYLLRSTSGFAALQFGVSTDIPTPNSFVP